MSHLMRNSRREFCFAVGSPDQAITDVKKTARQCDGRNVVGIQNSDLEWNLRIGVSNNLLSDRIDISNYRSVIVELGLLFQLLSRFTPHFNLLLQAWGHQAGGSGI